MSNAIVSIYEKVVDEYVFTGSGFFISDKLFVTAAHVIRDGGKFLCFNGTQLKFELLFCCYIAQQLLGEDDLAICQLPNGSLHPHYLELVPEMTTELNHQISGFLASPDRPSTLTLHVLDCMLAGRYPREKKIDLQGESSKRLFKLSEQAGEY